MDQELADAAAYAPGRCCVCTHQMAAICCVTLRHSHLERMSRLQKNSVNRWAFTWRTILQNFAPIRFETTGPSAFFEDGRPNNKNNNKKRNKLSSELAIWNQFLIQKSRKPVFEQCRRDETWSSEEKDLRYAITINLVYWSINMALETCSQLR